MVVAGHRAFDLTVTKSWVLSGEDQVYVLYGVELNTAVAIARVG